MSNKILWGAGIGLARRNLAFFFQWWAFLQQVHITKTSENKDYNIHYREIVGLTKTFFEIFVLEFERARKMTIKNWEKKYSIGGKDKKLFVLQFLIYSIFCANLILNVVYHPCSSSTSCPSSKTIWSKSAAFWDSSWSTNTGSRNPWGYLLYLTWKKTSSTIINHFGVQSTSFC